MSLRSIERSMVKHKCRVENGNTKNFHEEWKKYHDAKKKLRIECGDATVIRTKPKKKKVHYDNGKLAIRQWNRMKEMFANMKKQKQENAEATN